MPNPFKDPDYLWEGNLPIKDIKEPEPVVQEKPVAPQRAPTPRVRPASPDFHLEKLADSYLIQVPNAGAFELSSKLLENGERKTQDQWAEYTRQSVANGGFGVASAPTYTMLFKALYDARPDQKNTVNQHYAGLVNEVRSFLKDVFAQHWVETLTRVTYQSSDDLIAHNIGQPTMTHQNKNVKGTSGDFVKQALDEHCQALFQQDAKTMSDVYQWISDKSVKLWRLNNPPQQPDSRAVVLGVSDYGYFNLGAKGNLNDDRPALGVRPAQKNLHTK